MPSPSEPLVDERFRELAAQLREGRPQPPERLRERVRELALSTPPVPARRRRPELRRVLPLAAALTIAVALAGGIGLVASRSSGTDGAVEEAATPLAGAAQESAADRALRQAEKQAPATTSALPPSRTRAQEYRAQLRVHVRDVEDLSGVTSRAMRITRSLGGYVVSAQYDAPGDAEGDSVLVVRVPVGRIQDAIFRFSQLGTILAQHVSVADLQAQLDRQATAIAALEKRIAGLQRALDDPTLQPEERELLESQLAAAERALTAREGGRAQTQRRAATARVALTLTTREEVAPPPPPDENELGRTLRDAVSLLASVLTWTLAVLIVASPLLLLAAVMLLLVRLRRRAEERRLLERPAG